MYVFKNAFIYIFSPESPYFRNETRTLIFSHVTYNPHEMPCITISEVLKQKDLFRGKQSNYKIKAVLAVNRLVTIKGILQNFLEN